MYVFLCHCIAYGSLRWQLPCSLKPIFLIFVILHPIRGIGGESDFWGIYILVNSSKANAWQFYHRTRVNCSPLELRFMTSPSESTNDYCIFMQLTEAVMPFPEVDNTRMDNGKWLWMIHIIGKVEGVTSVWQVKYIVVYFNTFQALDIRMLRDLILVFITCLLIKEIAIFNLNESWFLLKFCKFKEDMEITIIQSCKNCELCRINLQSCNYIDWRIVMFYYKKGPIFGLKHIEFTVWN